MYKRQEHGSDALLDLCPDESLEVINPHRLNVVTDREKISYDPAEMDNEMCIRDSLRTMPPWNHFSDG